MPMSRSRALMVLAAASFGAAGLWLAKRLRSTPHADDSENVADNSPRRTPEIGETIDALDGVSVYHNGPVFTESHGRHFSPTGYYYGQKWQCVEFVKRYYFEAKKHRMPDVMGHAADFFDAALPSGALNRQRGLVQHRNGGAAPPCAGDLIVFAEMTRYGHVAIVSRVNADSVEMVQQNVGASSRATLRLTFANGAWTVGDEALRATGWLRPLARGERGSLRRHCASNSFFICSIVAAFAGSLATFFNSFGSAS